MENTVKTFTEIDDEIKRIRGEIKTLRSNKISLESDISSHMNNNQLEEIDCASRSTPRNQSQMCIKRIMLKHVPYFFLEKRELRR